MINDIPQKRITEYTLERNQAVVDEVMASIRTESGIVASYLPRDYALLDNRNEQHWDIHNWLEDVTDPSTAFNGLSWIIFANEQGYLSFWAERETVTIGSYVGSPDVHDLALRPTMELYINMGTDIIVDSSGNIIPMQRVPYRNEYGELIYSTVCEDVFMDFLFNFTWGLVEGIDSWTGRLEAVYDWIIRNFAYMNQRDGTPIDGTRRPDNVPEPASLVWVPATDFSTGESIQLPFIFNVPYNVNEAWTLMLTGEGVCNHFAHLFMLMAQCLGFEAHYMEGYYINTDGRRSGHAWTAVLFDTGYYIFDTQIEMSQLQRNRNNANYNPRGWWMQPINSERTQSRYDYDIERFKFD
jgi:hypothetical protein